MTFSDTKDLEEFCSILSKTTGLSFPISRYTFVRNQLTPLMEKYGCTNATEVIIKSKSDIKLRIELINSLTTHETWFFRHPKQFEILTKHILPELIEKKKGESINIWSAGCSIGAELYSILISILESYEPDALPILNLLGSDISQEAVDIAKKGIYSKYDLRTTDREIIKKYFTQISEESWQIKQELNKYITFENLNLLNNLPPRTFDIIFCRNTMIYFNEENKNKIVEKLFKTLELGGYFFTSANEQISINADCCNIKRLYLENEVVYQKSKKTSKYCVLYFNTASELLKAVNFLRKNPYEFKFGDSATNDMGIKVRPIYIKAEDSEKIIKTLAYNSIKIQKSEIISQ